MRRRVQRVVANPLMIASKRTFLPTSFKDRVWDISAIYRRASKHLISPKPAVREAAKMALAKPASGR